MPTQHVKLKPEQEKNLTTFLDDNLSRIRTRRGNRIRQWRLWREQYEGKVSPKNFPWAGASNVFVPQTAIDVDAIHANMMNRIFGHERVWDVTALRATEEVGVSLEDNQPITWADLATATQQYMQVEAGPTGMLDIYAPVEDAILECIKLGTSVLYNPWVTLTQTDYKYDEISGAVLSNEPVTIFDGLKPQVIPLEDFLVVPHYPEIHGPFAAPLFGHQSWLRRGQIIARAKEGKYRFSADSKELDSVLAHPGFGGDDSSVALKDQQAQLEGSGESFSEARRDDYLFENLWIRVQLDDGGVEVRLLITRHNTTGIILGVRPWPYLTAPYHVKRYVKREGSFYGIGVPEMLETIQRGINTTFNQSVDNATVANMRCFKVMAGSHAARSFGDIYPGKKIIVNKMDEIESFALGEVYPSIFQIGLNLRDFGERRTGISDFNLGKDTMKGSTATSTMALLQESARRFDLYAKDIRRVLGEIGMQSLELIAQHKPTSRIFATMEPKKAALVERVLTTTAQSQIREQLRVTATSASGASNKEIQRQSAVSVFGIITQYLERLTNLVPLLVNQKIPKEMRQLFYEMSQLGERAMIRILHSFDMPELAASLPQTEKLLNVQPQAPPGPNGEPGNVGGPDGVAAPTQDGANEPNAPGGGQR